MDPKVNGFFTTLPPLGRLDPDSFFLSRRSPIPGDSYLHLPCEMSPEVGLLRGYSLTLPFLRNVRPPFPPPPLGPTDTPPHPEKIIPIVSPGLVRQSFRVRSPLGEGIVLSPIGVLTFVSSFFFSPFPCPCAVGPHNHLLVGFRPFLFAPSFFSLYNEFAYFPPSPEKFLLSYSSPSSFFRLSRVPRNGFELA